MINTVYRWLKAMPGLETLEMEKLSAAPGSAGLFCKGRSVLRRSEDILGNAALRQSLTFSLCLHSTGREVPAFFLALDTQNAPTLGENQTVAVTRGRLTRDGGTGICRFEATVTFTFTSEG